MRKFPALLCLVVLSIMISLYPAQSQSAVQDDAIQKLLEEAYIPGMSLAYFDGSKNIVTKSLGYRSMDTQLPVDEETVFSAASLSKCIFGYLVLQLVEEGKFDLDKPLKDYFQYEEITHDPRHEEVTARMVLSHTSGLPNWRSDTLEFKYSPGERFGYSGEGYVWLQKTVEEITGSSLEELAQSRIFEPLDMNRTSYIWQDRFNDNHAIPHTALLTTRIKRKPENPNAAHSLQTTAGDYIKFLMTILNYEGLSMKMINEMLLPQITGIYDHNDEHVSWGLGVGLQKTKDGTEFWHWGDNGTFKAYFTVSKTLKKGLVYFANSSNGLSITPEIAGLILGSRQPGWIWNEYPHYQSPASKILHNTFEMGYENAIQPYLTSKGIPDTNLVTQQGLENTGSQMIIEKRFDEAKKVFTAGIRAYPESSKAYQNLAKYYLVTGTPEQALLYYQTALFISGTNEKAKKMVEQLTQPMNGNIEFKISGYPNAHMVSVVGDFNNWDDTANLLTWKDGVWFCKMHVPKGEFRYKIAVDGIFLLDPSNPASSHNGRTHYSILSVRE